MTDYEGKFEIALSCGEYCYLDSLKNLGGVAIGSEDPREFMPLAFCTDQIITIAPIRYEEGVVNQDDLIELAAYVANCNRGE